MPPEKLHLRDKMKLIVGRKGCSLNQASFPRGAITGQAKRKEHGSPQEIQDTQTPAGVQEEIQEWPAV